MTRAMKITFAVAAIIGLFLGTISGCYEAKEASGLMQSAEVLSIPSVVSDFARQQFEHADSVHARQAVLLEIKILEQLERAAQDSTSAGQLGLAYTRLGMIEEAAGQTDAQRKALDQARRRFRQAHSLGELTDEQLKSTLRRLDSASDRL